jgi:hypothetical protein
MRFGTRSLLFVFLDYIATPRQRIGGGAGGALYERLREEARALGVQGIYLECAPDIREECASDDVFRQNVARLRFYERFGARPVEGTDFRLPMRPGDSGYPYLVFDALGSHAALRRDAARRAVRSILERKYGKKSSSTYRDQVVRSFRDDPIRRRALRYLRRCCEDVPEGRSVYPYVFPIRNLARPPTDLSMRAGYCCIDTFTPLHRNAWAAARGAVDCALTAAAAIEACRHLAYALVRLNLPLPEAADGARYRDALDQALGRIRRFRPTYLVVALGLDTAKGDPTGTWTLGGRDFEENGRRIGALRLPTLVVQEGGYRTRTLGTNARRFFEGLHAAIYGAPLSARAAAG